MSTVKIAAAVGLIAGGAVLLTEHFLKKAEQPASLGNIANSLLDTMAMGAQLVTAAVANIRGEEPTKHRADTGDSQ